MSVAIMRDRLASAVASLPEVRALGQTGGTDIPSDGGDVDIFVYCGAIPERAKRESAYISCGIVREAIQTTVCENCVWGTGDVITVGSVPIMFMYFIASEEREFVEKIRRGELFERDGGFYPSGRCASIAGIGILHDDGTLASLRALAADYPAETAARLARYHAERIVEDEDLRRSAETRDIFFYHMALENDLDRLLQALFALNRVWFPSRKRSERYLRVFSLAPERCLERLRAVIADSVVPERVPDSVASLRALADETVSLLPR